MKNKQTKDFIHEIGSIEHYLVGLIFISRCGFNEMGSVLYQFDRTLLF